MRLKQLESLLDSLKGEESVFQLYQSGKTKELKEIYELFLATGLHKIVYFNDLLTKSKVTSPKAIAVYGEKGVGKSTLVSTFLVNHYLAGNIDAIRYLRYDPSSQNFDQIFELIGKNPKSQVVVLDDIHFFMPDFINYVLIKGSVRHFDKFVRTLFDIDSLLRTSSIKSMLLYISDHHAFRALQAVYDELLSVAYRDDLIRLLPRIPESDKLSTPFEIELDKEFYGKTYAAAGGRLNLYKIADVFGNVLREETGLLATNPRLLKFLIRGLRRYRELDYRLFDVEEIGASIIKGELMSLGSITELLYKRAEQAIMDFYSDIDDIRLGAEGEVRKLVGGTSQTSNNIRSKMLDIEELLSEKVNRLYRLEDDLESADISTRVIPREKQIVDELNHKAVVETLVGSFDTSVLKLETEEIKKQFGGFTSAMNRGYRSLVDLTREAQRSLRILENNLMRLQETLDHYTHVIQQSDQQLDRYPIIYSEVKNKAQEYASNNPELFYTLDVEAIKNLLDNPKEAIKKINPHTIDLIRNLSIIPY